MHPYSKVDQAKYRLDFKALEIAAVEHDVSIIVDQQFRAIFSDMTHDAAVCEINRLAIKGVFLPLSLTSIAVTKFCSERLGRIEDAERFFELTLRKYSIEPHCAGQNQHVHKLFSEVMWMYIKRHEYNKKRVVELVNDCPCTETYNALMSFYNRTSNCAKTIQIHESWPVDMRKDGSSYRYYAYALQKEGRLINEIQEMFERARFDHPGLMDDDYFVVDYIKLGLRSSKTEITQDELDCIEALFVQFPHYKSEDKLLRELLQAYFDAKQYDKARDVFMPCLAEKWLTQKTCESIVKNIAEVDLKEALALYARLFPNDIVVDFENCTIQLDLHKRLVSSHGAQEYGAQPLLLIKVKLWYLYGVLLFDEKFTDKQRHALRISIITGKGRDQKLKTFTADFIKAQFGWDCFKYGIGDKSSGAITLSFELMKFALAKKAITPAHLTDEFNKK